MSHRTLLSAPAGCITAAGAVSITGMVTPAG